MKSSCRYTIFNGIRTTHKRNRRQIRRGKGQNLRAKAGAGTIDMGLIGGVLAGKRVVCAGQTEHLPLRAEFSRRQIADEKALQNEHIDEEGF